ncbi:MAG: VOC family protein [Chloroflexota bacterium]|nr:VOC family protein [Chloroflexota bacterium]MDQ5867188.1 VOC family protein [Chloroflexota bacterium]
MPIVGLDHVQVAAPRTEGVEEQARAFYGGLLGLQELEKPGILKPKGGVWFSLGNGELHVGLEDAFSPALKAHPALLVTDLPTLRRRLEEAGLTIAQAEPIPGVSRFYVSDPFGNRLELTERL